MKLTSPDSDGLTDEEFEEYKRLTTEQGQLTERKVLKVGNGNSQPTMNMDMNAGLDQQANMNMGDVPDGDMNMEPMSDQGSEFDTNFDAGVEADEDEDPKKYIQQLTGKLSQELGKYNNELGEPDIELSKYVGGMIIKQVAKNLDDSDKKELIKKINTTSSEEPETEVPMGDEELENTEPELQGECYILDKKGVNKLMESFINKTPKTKKTPYNAPKFK